ncbi:MAG: hypothetical protein ABJF10_01880 [Chthoniobacter sp.]|uniref:hypothetical protein n=1 Tax=Chthoniobacter sp. TaxID=2510640 RepID=UPI0032AE6B23
MRIAVREFGFFIRNLSLRVPFRYGIATMTRTPHFVVRLVVEIDGIPQHGFAADNLPPKWFTKNPDAAYADEIADIIAVARHAAETACTRPPAGTVFEFWQEIAHAQDAWAQSRQIPPLLAGFGVSLVERAVIDAFCRATHTTFAEAIRANTFGIDLAVIHPELAGLAPVDLLPPAPRRSVIVRHTVGMADPLVDGEEHDHPDDGLPLSLEAFIRTHGLTHFKIKLGGNIDQDRERLHRLAGVIEKHTPEYFFTLDGNENYRAVAPFRELWEGFCADPSIARFLQHLIFVEQPFHRAVALSDATTAELRAWTNRPPIIIDESDADCSALPTALAGGYAGTSHKNCKGVFHGLASACLIAQRRRLHPQTPLHISAEDLTNLGPIALLQDLAVVATLGITHAERNGHHYFAGLSQFPESVRRETLRHHGDLYESHVGSYPIVAVKKGALEIGSLVDAPFGVAFEPDLTGFTPVETWRFESLEAM